ncbi:MAG: Superoxide dismutase [Cu-Zn] precursor [uncultured Chloroflexi bacterium]|uniref:Superoxide dismutase [Cu-Zn] n=1 Tax=uncultured Chloroflexota bacterium TaxID=166587 RepID=A0A6J4JPK2_9CHLR|nr:MAG: Superoxide dismutase [Cu-Zn] precursor [uncultured Chloroflexota bacterium]
MAAGVAVVGMLAAPQVTMAQGGMGATAMVRDANGRMVGTAVLSEVAGGVRITMQAQGLPAGRHGIHLHAVGMCEPPAFTSAGGHFNPTNQQHGLNNPSGPHAGDLPELTAAANGTASYSATNTMVTLSAGPNSLFDADGTALVIHAQPDDQVTDPTGNSGDRIACGTLVRGASALPATGSAAAPLIPVGAGAVAGLAAWAGALVRRRRAR